MKPLANFLVTLHLYWLRLVQARRITSMIKDPMQAQRAVLAKIIHANRRTLFGKKYDFEHISNYDEFAKRVPVNSYEALRPFIETEIEKNEPALTAEPPVHYVRTSGTTDKPKDIPLTLSHAQALQRINQTAVAFQHRTCPEAFSGSILAIVSPPQEGVLANGKPFGSASGIIARNTPKLVQEKFVIPASVLTIKDSKVKYLLILRLAIARSDITYIGSANPTTLLTLIKLYREYSENLIEDLRQGTFFLYNQVPSDVRASIKTRLAANSRADQLAQIHHARITDLWPELRLVVTWTCASAGVAADALRQELSSRTRILELGYLASELRATITIGKRAGSGLPTLDTHFFEFVECEKWDSGQPELLTLDQLSKGAEYYIIVTTPSGLYRYFMNDLVKVTGHIQQTPLLQFLQKGKGVTNITGEKLYEAQVLTAVRTTLTGFGCAPSFIMMLADDQVAGYSLYVETESANKPCSDELAEVVDHHLQAINIEYAAKRESQRLKPLSAAWLRNGTANAYKEFCVGQGQREGQFKPIALAYHDKFPFDLEMHKEQQ